MGLSLATIRTQRVSGNVKRQNGVADFGGAFTENNNSHTEDGDVIRQNGVIADETADLRCRCNPSAREDMDKKHPPTRRLKVDHESESTSDNDVKVDSSPTYSSNSSMASSSAFDFGPIQLLENGIVIRNKITGNTVTNRTAFGEV